MIVENRAGASGNIGTDFVAKAAPDGYTLLVGYVGNLAVNPFPFTKLPYDPSTTTPEKLAEMMKTELAKWGKVVKASGAKLE